MQELGNGRECDSDKRRGRIIPAFTWISGNMDIAFFSMQTMDNLSVSQERLLACIERVPYFYYLLKLPFSYALQICQLFIVLRQPVDISVTVFSNLTKLTNDPFI